MRSGRGDGSVLGADGAGPVAAGDLRPAGLEGRSADRRELRRPTGADGDGGPEPRSRLRLPPAGAGYGTVPELLPGRAADLCVGRGGAGPGDGMADRGVGAAGV